MTRQTIQAVPIGAATDFKGGNVNARYVPGVPCDGECGCWHPEGPLTEGWTVTVQEDRVVVLCPKCEEVWSQEEVMSNAN